MSKQKKLLEGMLSGWRRHHKILGVKAKEMAEGQDPKLVTLSCSDSRVDVDEIFNLSGQGNVFQIKNVGGLFTGDAKAALVYALRHLKPDILLLLHHTNCGGYGTLYSGRGVEDEITGYMRENNAAEARDRVLAHLKEKNRKIDDAKLMQLTIEEGARIQAKKITDFFSENYPDTAEKLASGEILLLTAVYDIAADEVYLVPEKLEGPVNQKRQMLAEYAESM